MTTGGLSVVYTYVEVKLGSKSLIIASLIHMFVKYPELQRQNVNDCVTLSSDVFILKINKTMKILKKTKNLV